MNAEKYTAVFVSDDSSHDQLHAPYDISKTHIAAVSLGHNHLKRKKCRIFFQDIVNNIDWQNTDQYFIHEMPNAKKYRGHVTLLTWSFSRAEYQKHKSQLIFVCELDKNGKNIITFAGFADFIGSLLFRSQQALNSLSVARHILSWCCEEEKLFYLIGNSKALTNDVYVTECINSDWGDKV